jgi:hypothetical protein
MAWIVTNKAHKLYTIIPFEVWHLSAEKLISEILAINLGNIFGNFLEIEPLT